MLIVRMNQIMYKMNKIPIHKFSLEYLIDCTLNKKATKKQDNMQKYLIEKLASLLSPKTKISALFLPPLVINTAMRELNIIAVDAKRVDAIMLFLSV